MDFARYERQMALPEIGPAQQERLSRSKIIIVGAGGLGAAALPYLAAAGIGHITIADHDAVSRNNLHRQTIYQDVQAGKSKAELAAQYAAALNPEITVRAASDKISAENATRICGEFDLILDGSDNFQTKSLLNQISVKTGTPLIAASVNQFAGQLGVFAGYAKDRPCYHCLFPDLPADARNCNEAGILGTSAGLTGLYQAHLTLLYLLGIGDIAPGVFLSLDFKALRVQKLTAQKDSACPHCSSADEIWKAPQMTQDIEMFTMADLASKDHVIIDVRNDDEVEADPLEGNVVHIALPEIPARMDELPADKLLAFVCAGNVRSFKAAEYAAARGMDNICVLDKFSL